MKRFLVLLTVLLVFSSCNEYQKAMKSEDVALKFTTATKLYDKADYNRAILLIEQIAPAFRGKPQAEKLFYMYSQSLYQTKQYGLAAFQFESFTSTYPKSEKAEETFFLSAKCYAKMSPKYTLDQTDTNKALAKIQEYIDRYPESQNMTEANEMTAVLRNKLEQKAFENAKQFNTISDYKASLVALENFITDFPGTPYKEDALYYKLDSAYLLAINSVPSKMEERLTNAKIAYDKLIKFNNDTKYKDKADKMLATIDKELQQFSNK
jgi:outer membrane protein assembly factor BamD